MGAAGSVADLLRQLSVFAISMIAGLSLIVNVRQVVAFRLSVFEKFGEKTGWVGRAIMNEGLSPKQSEALDRLYVLVSGTLLFLIGAMFTVQSILRFVRG